MTSTLDSTPRGALELAHEGERIVARFRCDEDDWRAGARAVVERARRLSHPAIVPVVDVVEDPHGLEVSYAPARGWTTARGASVEQLTRAGADAAAAIVALQVVEEPRLEVGPLSRSLLLLDAGGQGALLAVGLWSYAYRYDGGLRGATMTTRHFILSPEHAHAVPRTGKTDVYFLGVLLYQLLTGREPHPTTDEFTYVRSVMESEGTPLREVRPDAPPALASLVDACVARNPAARPEPAELERRLRALVPAAPVRRPWWKVWGA